jgi:ABC-type dipeptide/oligopeptide/nickel transport system ATPase component
MAQVSIRKVVKAYEGDVQAVKGIDLDIADHEFCVLVGPSGCGKSTTLRMIAGLEEITSGEIAIGGTVVNDIPPRDRDIAMVFQNYALYPHMTVFDNMGFGLTLRKFAKEEIKRRVDNAKHPRPHALPRPQAEGALGRPAPARRDGPRHRPRARRSSSWTSRCRTSTPSCACRPAPRSKRCSSAGAPPRSTSPTTRSRR